MDLKLHANATTTPRIRAYIQKSAAPNTRWPVSWGFIRAPWRDGRAAGRSSIDPPGRTAWRPR
jgi:hypothetical protein